MPDPTDVSVYRSAVSPCTITARAGIIVHMDFEQGLAPVLFSAHPDCLLKVYDTGYPRSHGEHKPIPCPI
jgi:hypothetical protein